MILEKEINLLPKTLEEFIEFESNDGLKYEWNDGELITFEGLKSVHLQIYRILSRLFFRNEIRNRGTIVAKQDVMLTPLELRRPDIAYFTKEQVKNTKNDIEEIPEFVIEVISGNDNINKVEEKIIEYFKAGVKIVWLIMPESRTVHVYTSKKNVTICYDNDICSAKPVLEDFEISVNDIFAD
jgi:Uma2 family endonuclease